MAGRQFAAALACGSASCGRIRRRFISMDSVHHPHMGRLLNSCFLCRCTRIPTGMAGLDCRRARCVLRADPDLNLGLFLKSLMVFPANQCAGSRPFLRPDRSGYHFDCRPDGCSGYRNDHHKLRALDACAVGNVHRCDYACFEYYRATCRTIALDGTVRQLAYD